MAKLALLASLATLAITLGIATVSSTDVEANPPCVTTAFKTEMVKDACKKGGQPAAKDAMKKFMKAAKLKSCNACHDKLAPKYPLKKDGLAQFKKLGGK